MESRRGERRVRGLEPLGPIVARCLDAAGLVRPAAQQELLRAWCEAVGAEVASHTRVAGLRKNVLEVVVDSAPRLHELANFRKASLLERLGAALGATYVRDIRFRPGPVTGAAPGSQRRAAAE